MVIASTSGLDTGVWLALSHLWLNPPEVFLSV